MEISWRDPSTSGWHSVGMEWREHVAWIAPIGMTMVAYVYAKYGTNLSKHRGLRNAALIFAVAAFVATAVAGGFGAMMNKYARCAAAKRPYQRSGLRAACGRVCPDLPPDCGTAAGQVACGDCHP